MDLDPEDSGSGSAWLEDDAHEKLCDPWLRTTGQGKAVAAFSLVNGRISV